MSLGSRVLARWAGLPPAHTHKVDVERDLRVPMPDGVELLADRYFPRHDGKLPIVLLRSPYGRRQVSGALGRIFAERGYQSVVQSTRGTFGSGGDFEPYRHEASDGRATLDWLAARPWFGGSVAMFGGSYLGFVQWAVAADAPAFLKALAAGVTASQFRSLTYGGEAFSLDTALTWMHMVHYQELPPWRNLRAILTQRKALAPAFTHAPLNQLDTIAVGRRVTFFQDWLQHNQPGDPYWQAIDHSRGLGAVTAPVYLLAGWYDIFLPEQLADYVALKRAGQKPHLMVGPWIHVSLEVARVGIREGLAWFDVHLRGDATRLSKSPVRVFVMGARRWLDLPDWPPLASPSQWYLQPAGGLAPEPPPDSRPDRYDYDPANPTPSVGGTVFGRHAGPKDNRKLESRSDVLTFTSAPLDRELEVIGPVAAELYIRSSLQHTDFFARLCDVEPSGRSVNVCDGLVRLWPMRFAPGADGSIRIRIDLWPTAYAFRKGHHLRLQVSSGAHPRFSRNLGSGESLATAATFKTAHQDVFHDPTHPSALQLPEHAGGSR